MLNHAIKLANALDKLLKIYAMSTAFCFLFDLIDMIIQLVRLGRTDDVYSDAMMLTCTCLLIVTDIYYALWIGHLQIRMPKAVTEKIA